MRALLLVSVLMAQTTFAQQLLLVVNVPEGAGFDIDHALSLIRGDTTSWDGGKGARVLLPSRQSSSYEPVAKAIFGMSGTSMERHWFRLVFSGKANPPEYVPHDADIIRLVKETPGALGVVASSAGETAGLLAVPLE